MEFGPFFNQYEVLVHQVDGIFEKVQGEFETQVACRLGCSDCCYALFDLSLIEALYLKQRFDDRFTGTARSSILERADAADRAIYRLKKQAFKDHEAGKSEADIIVDMAAQRVRCPALDEKDQCSFYDIRPITCRLYGIPTEIGGQAHTCGKSGFLERKAYPTVKLEAIHQRLYKISSALAQTIGSRFPNLAEMIVPLSMALLTDYSEAYLGVRDAANEDASADKESC